MSDIAHTKRQGVQRLTISDVESMFAAAVAARDSKFMPLPPTLPTDRRSAWLSPRGGRERERTTRCWLKCRKRGMHCSAFTVHGLADKSAL